MELPVELLDDIADVLADCCGVVPHDVAGIMGLCDRQILGDVIAWGANDSQARDLLCDAVARLLAGRAWPTFGDNVDIDVFQAQIDDAAAARGWHVCSRDGDRPVLTG